MSLKQIYEGKGKIQQVYIYNRKLKFKRKKLPMKQAKTKFRRLQFVEKEVVYRYRVF